MSYYKRERKRRKRIDMAGLTIKRRGSCGDLGVVRIKKTINVQEIRRKTREKG